MVMVMCGYKYVHPGISTGSLLVSVEKHSTSAASDSEDAKNAPRAAKQLMSKR